MRIVVANKFWYARGGLENVMFEEVRLLEEAGHDVAHFSTRHAQNLPSPWSAYFCEATELGRPDQTPAADKARAAARMFCNLDAGRAFGHLLDDFQPHVVHLHGVHRQLSPTVVAAANRRRIPVVQTLHDYHAICPSDTLLRGGSQACVPPLCTARDTRPAVRHRCEQDRADLSALAAAELWSRTNLWRYGSRVSAFIAPSRFLADLVAARLPGARRVELLPNPVAERPAAPLGSSFLFAGHLLREKGLRTLLEAAVAVPGARIVVAGAGPLEAELAGAPPNVDFAGWVGADEVARLLADARAAVVPSVCVECASLSALEAMASGRAVVASAIGGLPELVRHRREGLLFPPGDADALAGAIAELAADPELAASLGAAAQTRCRERFSPERHIEGLLGIYRSLVGRTAA